MEIVPLMLPLALLLGGAFLWAFIWATRQGQSDERPPSATLFLLEDLGAGSSPPRGETPFEPRSPHPVLPKPPAPFSSCPTHR